MEHISLYRKWRPQALCEVVGQRHVTDTLANALSGGRLVHAYLFSGPRGTGKTSTARILAKAINCDEGPTATPCNTCDACVSISQGTALDVIEIDAASNRRIDEIRGLLEKIPFAPTAFRTKVYIIDEVHQLTPEASSALLKTLEEPPGHVIFVLATTEPHKLLPTIVSRCQRFEFSLVPTKEISRLLGQIASREEIDIEEEALGMIAEHAHGSVRDAIGVIDQISNFSGKKVTLAQLAQILGEVETDLTFEMVDLIAERETPGALALVGSIVDAGKDPRRFVESLISHLRCLFLIQNAAKAEEIVEATEDHYQRLAEQSNRLRRFEVIRLMERLGETHRQMRWSENPRVAIECALVKATKLDADISLEGLDFRISEMEKKLEALSGEAAGRVAPQRQAASEPVKAVRDAAAPGNRPEEKVEPAAVDEESKGSGGEDGRGRPPTAEVTVREETRQAGQASVSDREKARRAWAAVLAEFKKLGKMRLYAILTKAKIQEVSGGEIMLGFPEDASFQMDLLKDSGDIGLVEEAWSRFLGEPVSIRLEGLRAREPAPKKQKGQAVAPPREEAGGRRAGSEGRHEEPGKEPREEEGPPEDAPEGAQKSESETLANHLKEQFDGEIVERENKGKS
ncbi:MAG: DNA polymerase III subunit gamma/tau [Actinomycetia bacterium]|nr:DNA polymerase III subunit gamma/tau [Actinomycetes bacterium]